MTRFITNRKKIYAEGKREYHFFEQILQITNNTKKFFLQSLGGSSHQNMINKVIFDRFNGDKICIIDNSNRTKGKIPLLLDNTGLLSIAKSNNINLIISINQFDDEIIDFVDIKKTNKNAKNSIDKYLKYNNLSWSKFVESQIKDKSYIRNNLDEIKNDNLKQLLSNIVNSYKEDHYN